MLACGILACCLARLSQDACNMLKTVIACIGAMLLGFCFEMSWGQPAPGPGPTADKLPSQVVEFFESKVRPVLAERCFRCHGPEKQKAGLRLDSREAMLKGSESGPVIVPGQPEKSLVIKAIQQQGDLKMPPDEKLPDEAVANLGEWIKAGAPWPGTGIAAAPALESWKTHWAFQPVSKPAPPQVDHLDRVQTPIDAFILAELEKQGLTFAAPADKRTLLRRATFDLIGLPPTPEEIDAFESDAAPDAFASVIDRLLASPHYGERWGRHWLDVARYADTKGYVFQEERRYAYAYTYRDYVIQAFNDDVPYDRFVLEQLAADRLFAEAKAAGNDPDSKSLAAMGFLTLGRRFLNNQHDIIDDRIDVATRGLLGLTVACARCHDHKFDPIPTKDYYSLYGVFSSSAEPKELPLLGPPPETPEYLVFVKELKIRQQAVADFQVKNKAELDANNRKFKDELKALQKKVEALEASSPGAPPRAMVLQDLPKPREPRVFLRGNPGNAGPAVPRQFLGFLTGDKRQPFQSGSGRLELAQAIAAPDNPLTARVLVNRVWLHHFGNGLVRTPSDFGRRSEPPSHPALLDYLASRFVEDGWSLKKLHKLIMLSSVYQQGSLPPGDTARLDPENRLLSRMSRRRLDFEALRDSLLYVSGLLDAKMGGPAVEMFEAKPSKRRTVYGFIDRQNLPGMLRTFDFASPDASNPQRYETTVPQQALFLMNNNFVVDQARSLVKRPDIASVQDLQVRVRKIHRLLYGRAPTATEMNLAERFLAAGETNGTASATLTPWEQYVQVLLLSNEFAFVD
jgi:Protein of unknown function (DUF1553)/Protein of unknown function (DUF1549)/Planctomycete cytochrome C